jgi:hypothetical protein
VHFDNPFRRQIYNVLRFSAASCWLQNGHRGAFTNHRRMHPSQKTCPQIGEKQLTGNVTQMSQIRVPAAGSCALNTRTLAAWSKKKLVIMSFHLCILFTIACRRRNEHSKIGS